MISKKVIIKYFEVLNNSIVKANSRLNAVSINMNKNRNNINMNVIIKNFIKLNDRYVVVYVVFVGSVKCVVRKYENSRIRFAIAE